MWKVVLIDDDERVLRGLKMIIPWEELECEWAGQARDGVEGIQLVKETKPDVIMTDIYMPLKNGLDMIEELQEWGFHGQVIVLSGYNDFEYARKALRLQINDYLSKPASKETIRTVFQQAIARLEERKQEEQMEKEWVDSVMTDAIQINWERQTHYWEDNVQHRKLVEQMLGSIQERLDENITLQDFANELYISRNYLGRIFRKVVGESFKDYLLRVRMDKAKKMIHEGSYLIYEISEKVGYTNPAYFSSTFKKYTGHTPTELIQKRARVK